MKKYKAIIIEDEVHSSNLLKYLIDNYCSSIKIVSIENNIEQGKLKISEYQPDLLFLDVKLEDRDVFELLDDIDVANFEIIFVTAYDDYAIKGYKYNAIDYILKPISIEDLVLATNCAINRIEEKIIFENAKEGNFFSKSSSKMDFLKLSSLDRIDLVLKDDILYCKSDGRYTTFYLKDKSQKVVCKNIGEYEKELSDKNFPRIHHSYIVNLSYVKTIHKKNGFYCEMFNGVLIPVSKRKQEVIIDILK